MERGKISPAALAGLRVSAFRYLRPVFRLDDSERAGQRNSRRAAREGSSFHIPRSSLNVLRLVLDTNVWLDWLVFDDPAVAPVKAAVAEGRAAGFIDEAVQAELVRVLAYPFGTRTLGAQAQAAAIAECLRVARKDERGTWKDDLTALPKCSDPDDQKFLELALACGAEFLLTRDDALLELKRNKVRPLPYRIIRPGELIAELEGAGL